ncbi:bolA-like protein DDB_G0274169 isoform X2 [Penaeus japonicus]|uniref:bolA-like protein DDB_G0274169 isoform X2 n=1 Tax=Penaeus japonicus TaxID=27405 RepID=UPI001C7163AB|nr:bolA-like protein DDB_G0274169 isoform X2 [Penaeus japonicus]XP_042886622.1 bolA-like protein DDB_G0274169 isoform X2 [Penaeus japonicus]
MISRAVVVRRISSTPSFHNRRGEPLQKMSSNRPVESAIKKKLVEAFQPVHLMVVNESFMHNVPPGSETHFKVLVVSPTFENVPLIKRHRLVNAALSEELAAGVHALSIVARTPGQWEKSSQELEQSPACRGGFGK